MLKIGHVAKDEFYWCPALPDYTYYSPPALGDETMVMPFRSGVSEWRGFQVYAVPEPGAAGVLGALALAALARRRSRA